MTSSPRFVRFTAPFWFALQGYDEEAESEEIDYTDDGPVLVRQGTVNPDVPYVGVVHAGSVLPVSSFDKANESVTVRLPAPWNTDQEGIPLWPDVIVPADGQDGVPAIEEVGVERARELFPDQFQPVTQDQLDAWADED
ncbi:hypothetical protein [Microbacterium sp. 77mftsu3.1]|uniref:hypothetical protein n=1 Tax=Microbacterium sp. 77mftsu3.1 TaxID=1761802 RepID=UPI0003710F4B|nr:hypothetical protein [Microbacterium sp. 77mftsu3.1]